MLFGQPNIIAVYAVYTYLSSQNLTFRKNIFLLFGENSFWPIIRGSR